MFSEAEFTTAVAEQQRVLILVLVEYVLRVIYNMKKSDLVAQVLILVLVEYVLRVHLKLFYNEKVR